MATLPTFTKLIDNSFTQTFYEVRAQAADNVLLATVVWALLKMRGCFTEQSGGNLIERTVRYAYQNATAVQKGDTLTTGETESRTAAFWTFRNVSNHIQRDAFTDAENRGKFKIQAYIEQRTMDCLDGIKQKYETDVLRAVTTDESGKEIQSLQDIVPPFASATTGTFGRIARPTAYTNGRPSAGNTFWGPCYKQLTAPTEVNLVSDMKNFFNTVTNQQETPDVILTTQTLYELFEDFGLDSVQYMGNTKLLDLGFESLKFKGQDLVWTPNMTTGDMLFLNTRHIEAVYDPGMWFDMSDWKPIYNQTERIAHVLCRMNLISDQLRRHGRLYT